MIKGRWEVVGKSVMPPATNIQVPDRYTFISSGLLWTLYFCYATIAALLFQKLVLPMIPSLHAGHGLMINDASYFHSVAVKLAEDIRENGWGHWSIWSSKGTAGNVAVTAALYVLFGNDPALVIPLNAAFHALGGLFIFLLGRELWPGKVGDYGGLAASLLFIVFPSSLIWYGQLHKDSYSIVGVLALLFIWIRALKRLPSPRNGLWLISGTVGGMLLLAFARPYYVKLMVVACSLLYVIIGIVALCSWDSSRRWKVLSYYLIALLALGLGAKYNTAHGSLDGTVYEHRDIPGWAWQDSPWLSAFVENPVKLAAKTRAGMIQYNLRVNAGSSIDMDRAPQNVMTVLAYMPRALQIGMFAPFPDAWFVNITAMRLVALLEMVAWYFCIPGVLLAIWRRGSPEMAMAIIFSLFFLGVLAFVTPNVGTLYRVRYAYLFVFILIGAMGWVDFFLNRAARRVKNKAAGQPPDSASARKPGATTDGAGNALLTRTAVVNAGAIVIVLTLLSYVGFFVRDVLMARRFGVGSDLDTFYIGVMLPMFFVAVFSMPCGAAMTPAFLEFREKLKKDSAQKFVVRISMSITVFLGALCLLLYLFSPSLLPVLCRNFSPAKLSGSLAVLNLFLPILLLSGVVILCNSLLNALGKFLVPGLAQAVVPIAAIAALFTLSSRLGVLSVAVGMVIGQMLNLLIVALYLKKHGWSIVPKWGPVRAEMPEYPLTNQYMQLAAAALFASAVVPINNAIATMLGNGAVATLALGTKMVVFITGLISTGVTSVMIPYFSAYAATEQLVEARRELSFFLVIVTCLLIPVTLLLYLASPAIIRILLQGGAMDSGDIAAIAKVMQYGIVQLPFFTSSILIMKFATAHRRAGLVLLASVAGLGLNIAFSLLFMRYIGVAGIAMATTLAMAISTGLLLVLIHRLGQIAWLDVLILLMSWLLFSTLVVCLHYNSYTGIFAVLLAFVLLLAGQWKVLFAARSVA